MKCPEYIRVGNKEYKINTDFRIAIECNEIAENPNIGDYERALAIIYKLYGSEALNDFQNHQKILELTKKYLACGEEIKETHEKPDMDYVEDMDYIEASFMSDYNIDLSNTNMDWYKFNKLINGLSNSDMGNCCILNRVRNLRNFNVNEIKDQKEKQKIIKAKQQVALKKNKAKKQATEKQKESAKKFIEALGLKGGN